MWIYSFTECEIYPSDRLEAGYFKLAAFCFALQTIVLDFRSIFRSYVYFFDIIKAIII